MWSNLEEINEDPRRHNDKIPTCAGPGKAANDRDGCRHHEKISTCASPGKAANCQDGCRHHDNPSNACPGADEASKGNGTSDHRVDSHHDNSPNVRSSDEASNGRRFSDHSCDGTPSQRTSTRLKASNPARLRGHGDGDSQTVVFSLPKLRPAIFKLCIEASQFIRITLRSINMAPSTNG